MIKKVDRQPRAKTESVLLSDGQAYALLYLRLLKKLERADTVQAILVLIADALVGKVVHTISTHPSYPYQITMSGYHCSRGPRRTIQSCRSDRYCGQSVMSFAA
jgi:hypothetical protein